MISAMFQEYDSPDDSAPPIHPSIPAVRAFLEMQYRTIRINPLKREGRRP